MKILHINLDISLPESIPTNTRTTSPSLIIDDLVEDALSSVSSLSIHTPVDQRSASPDIAQLLLLNRNVEGSQEFTTMRSDDNHFYEEKRLIEQELELIRRERENLLNEHETYRQQAMYSIEDYLFVFFLIVFLFIIEHPH